MTGSHRGTWVPGYRRLVLPTALAIGVAIAAASCGTGDDGAFQRIDSDELFGLDETTTTSTTTTTTTTIPASSVLPTTTSEPPTTVPTELIELYFVSGDHLEPVDRNLTRDPSATRVMTLLEEGPPPGEPGAGLRSFVQPGLITTVRESGSGFATVDLAGETFDAIEGRDQRIAIGQIVLTLTRRPGIGQVRFSLEGEPLAVPGAEGVQTDPGDPVARADYEDLLVVLQPNDTTADTTEATDSTDATDAADPTDPTATTSATTVPETTTPPG
jgi:hypothetical protein